MDATAEVIADLILWLIILGGWVLAVLFGVKLLNARDAAKDRERQFVWLYQRMRIRKGHDQRFWVHLEDSEGKDRYRSASSFGTEDEGVKDFETFFGEEPE